MTSRFALPAETPRGLNSPLTVRVIKLVSRVQVKLFRLTGGRIGSRWRVGSGFRKPVPTLLLEHRGRTSGRLFSTPLLYLEDGGRYVVVASQGGIDRHPQWYHNLCAAPATRILVRGKGKLPVRAHEATGAERDELWPRLVDLYADFATYAGWTGRQIPVMVLTPVSRA